MKKLLFIPLALIFIFALLYRGGISLHSHLLWAVLLIVPAIVLLFSRVPKIQANRNRILAYSSLILFAILFLLSIKFAPLQGWGAYDFFAYLSGITLFFIISSIYFSQRIIEKIFSFLVWAAGTVSVLGLVFYMALAPSRVFGTFADFNMLAVSFPNAFALFLLIIIPITIYKIFTARGESLKLFLVSGIAQFSAFILTFSRESWIVLILGAITATAILFWKSKEAKNLFIFAAKRLLIILAIAGLLAYGCSLVRSLNYGTPSVYKKITFQADEGKTSYTDRISLFKTSIKTIKEYPLLGWGPGAFEETVKNHQHNIFFKIAIDSGLIALVFFLLFLAFLKLSILKLSMKLNYKNLPRNSKNIIMVLCASVSFVLLQNLVDYNLNFVSNSFLFWGFLGLISSIVFQSGFGPKKLSYGYKNFYIILAVVLSAGLFVISLNEGFYKISFAKGKDLYRGKQYEEALKKFDFAQGLIFKGGLNYFIGQTYYKLAETKGFKPWGEQGAKFLSNLKTSEKTIDILALSNEFCLLNAGSECLDWAIPSLESLNSYVARELNPYKYIRVRYDFLNALHKAKKYNEALKYPNDTSRFLRVYQNMVERNEQLTIVTENPFYALKIYELFIDLKKQTNADEKTINDLTLAKVRLNRTINLEKKKYEALYGQAVPEE